MAAVMGLRRFSEKWITFALIAALGGRLALAEDLRWKSLGPWGGPVLALAVSPAKSNTVFASTYGAGFRSADAGLTWEPITYVPRLKSVARLVVDPVDPETIYAWNSYSDDISQTRDGGQTWTTVHQGRAIAVDPHNPRVLYVGWGSAVWKSVDRGFIWRSSTVAVGAQVVELAVAPSDPQTVYAGTSDGVVFRSRDGGASWDNAAMGYSLSGTPVLRVGPYDATTVYGGSSSFGVFKTTDGVHWAPANAGIERRHVASLAVDPVDARIVYAGMVPSVYASRHYPGGLYRSTDGGLSWQAIQAGLTNLSVRALEVDPDDPQVVYAATDDGVCKSTDRGAHWSPANVGISGWRVQHLEVGVEPQSRLYVGVSGTGVFSSSDAGLSWRAANADLENLGIEDLAVDPTNANVVYAGTRKGLRASSDGGASWPASLMSFAGGAVWHIAVNPAPPAAVLVSSHKGWFHRSADGSTGWLETGHPHSSGSPNRALTADPNHTGTFYFACEGLFKTSDNGGQWQEAASRLLGDVGTVTIDPTHGRTLYAGGNTVLRSADGGDTWTRPRNAGLSLSWPDVTVTGLVVDPEEPAVAYAAVNRDGVFITRDGGESWMPINPGLANPRVTKLVSSPDDSRVLFAATEGSGVFSLRIPETPGIVSPCPDRWWVAGGQRSMAPVALGGRPPYTWSIASGALPRGVTVDRATGLISGAPKGAGVYTYTLKVEDALFQLGTQGCTMRVVWPLVTNLAPRTTALLGTPFFHTFMASGGVPPFRWTLQGFSGAWATDVALSPEGGLRASFGASGRATFFVWVSDSGGQHRQVQLTVDVTPPRVRSRVDRG